MCEKDFQKDALEKLSKGQSVLIIAPTGLGKTRAALNPFSQSKNNGGLLGTRLIYTLPLRALARSVEDECKEVGLHPVIHHGDEPESEFFSERVVITTIDQYLTAFAGAPLSWASHLSHAAAGAVLTSYSVFDEVHLLSPQKGLPLLFAMLYLRKRWGMLSCVMTATLPQSVADFFKKHCGLEEVKASNKDIEKRDNWRKIYLQLDGKKQDKGFDWGEKNAKNLAEFVKEQWDKWGKLDIDGPQKVIVFVNTVERAIQVYDELKNLFSYPNGPEIILAHSRFTRNDRKIIEDELSKLFGKNADPKPAILVTTQVAEAGLNISAPLVITELCPMDSLIQRAGRCQRFNPDGTPECEGKRRKGKESKGKVIVVKPAEDRWYFPYNDKARLVKRKKVDKKGKRKTNVSEQLLAIEFTQVVLEMEAQVPLLLNWQKEEELINKALDRLYAAYLSGTTDVEFSEGEEPYISLFRKHQSKKQKTEEEEEESQSEGEE
jgi:CRISPR-associated endonuclease/helicase Cas3